MRRTTLPHERDADLSRKVRLAARAAARHGLVQAFGHVSVRMDAETFLVSAPQPLGTIAVGGPCVEVSLRGDLPVGALPEVRLHREIYRLRPEAGGICRIMPPSVMALSALGMTPRALHGPGSYFAPKPPLWPHVQLVREDERARAAAAMLGTGAAIVLRGNGAVTVGGSIEEALAYAMYLEDAARIELSLLGANAAGLQVREYTPAEAAGRATHAGGLIERMWQYLCFGDPEWEFAS